MFRLRQCLPFWQSPLAAAERAGGAEWEELWHHPEVEAVSPAPPINELRVASEALSPRAVAAPRSLRAALDQAQLFESPSPKRAPSAPRPSAADEVVSAFAAGMSRQRLTPGERTRRQRNSRLDKEAHLENIVHPLLEVLLQESERERQLLPQGLPERSSPPNIKLAPVFGTATELPGDSGTGAGLPALSSSSRTSDSLRAAVHAALGAGHRPQCQSRATSGSSAAELEQQPGRKSAAAAAAAAGSRGQTQARPRATGLSLHAHTSTAVQEFTQEAGPTASFQQLIQAPQMRRRLLAGAQVQLRAFAGPAAAAAGAVGVSTGPPAPMPDASPAGQDLPDVPSCDTIATCNSETALLPGNGASASASLETELIPAGRPGAAPSMASSSSGRKSWRTSLLGGLGSSSHQKQARKRAGAGVKAAAGPEADAEDVLPHRQQQQQGQQQGQQGRKSGAGAIARVPGRRSTQENHHPAGAQQHVHGPRKQQQGQLRAMRTTR